MLIHAILFVFLVAVSLSFFVDSAVMMLDVIILRYLQESGFVHSAFSFAHESMLGRTGLRASDKSVPPGALITFLQKGLQYVGIEETLARSNKQAQRGGTAAATATSSAENAETNSNNAMDFTLLSPACMTAITRTNPPIQLNVPPATAAAAIKARLEVEATKAREKNATLGTQPTTVNHILGRSSAPLSSTNATATNRHPSLDAAQDMLAIERVSPAAALANTTTTTTNARMGGRGEEETNNSNASTFARQALAAQAAAAHAAAAMSQLQQQMGQLPNSSPDSSLGQQQQNPLSVAAAELAQQQQQQQQRAAADILALQQQQHQQGAAALALAAAASMNRELVDTGGPVLTHPGKRTTATAAVGNLPISGILTGGLIGNKQQRRKQQQHRKQKSPTDDAGSLASAGSDISESQQQQWLLQQQQQQPQHMQRIQEEGLGEPSKRRRLMHSGEQASKLDSEVMAAYGMLDQTGKTIEGGRSEQQQQQQLIMQQQLMARKGQDATNLNIKNGEIDHYNGAAANNSINTAPRLVTEHSQINGAERGGVDLHNRGMMGANEPTSDFTSSGGQLSNIVNLPEGPDPDDLDTEAAKSEVLQLQMHESEVFMCAWNPVYTNLIATGSGDASARIWEMLGSNARAGLGAVKLLPHGTDPRDKKNKDVTTLEWSSDGEYLATGSYDGVARVWGRNGALLITLRKHTGPIFSLKWNKKGNYILSGSYDTTTIVWDVTGRKPDHVVQQFTEHKAPALDVDWRDNNTFASCSTDKSVHIYRIGDAKPLKIYTGHTDEVNAVKWDPTRNFLASCSDDCTAKVWAVESDSTSPLYTFDSHSQEIYTVKWSPSGPGTVNPNKQSLLATASFDGTVRLWSIIDGSCYRIFKRHRESVYSVAFSPSGDYLASGSLAGQLYIWNIEEGRHVKSYKGTGDIFEVAWNREGMRVAACFSSNSVAVIDFDRSMYDLQQQQQRGRLTQQQRPLLIQR